MHFSIWQKGAFLIRAVISADHAEQERNILTHVDHFHKVGVIHLKVEQLLSVWR
jgi:hypothetical protein